MGSNEKHNQAEDIRKLICKEVRKFGAKCRYSRGFRIRVDGQEIQVEVSATKARTWEKWDGQFRTKVITYNRRRQFPPRKAGNGVVKGVQIRAVAAEMIFQARQLNDQDKVESARLKVLDIAAPHVDKIRKAAEQLSVGIDPCLLGGEGDEVFAPITHVSLNLNYIRLSFADALWLVRVAQQLEQGTKPPCATCGEETTTIEWCHCKASAGARLAEKLENDNGNS